MSIGSPERVLRPGEQQQLVVAVVALLIVFAGFAPSFYLNSYFEQRSLDALRIAHGLVFSLWPVLLVAQVVLVRSGRADLHRRLGALGAFLAVTMLVTGLALAIHAGRTGFQTPGIPPPALFLTIPIFDMAVFAVLVSAAVALRNRRADHWRLMILATLSILPAAFGRLPTPGLSDPIIKAFAPAFVLLLACVVADAMKQRRLQRVWLWGGLLFVLSVPVRLGVASTSAWQRFAGWLLDA